MDFLEFHIHLGNITRSSLYHCKGTIAMKCRFKSYVAIVRNTTGQQCLEQCQHLGETKCQAILYNRATRQCQMINITVDEFLDTCGKIGGPKVCSKMDEQCVRIIFSKGREQAIS